MGTILLKNGNIWDGEKFFFSDLLINDGEIAKFAPNINEKADWCYDASGKIVSAGFVDIHMHLKNVSSEFFGTQGEASCFPFGVTAAVEASAIYGDEKILNSFALKNLVFVSTDIKNNKACFENTEKLLLKYGKKAIGLKLFFDTTGGEVSDITPLKEVCDFAHKRNLKVMVHSSNSPVKMSELLSVLEKGDILTHAYHGGLNNSSEDNFESLKRAKERGVIIDVGFAGFVHTDFTVFKSAMENNALPNTISTDLTKLSVFKRGGNYGMTMCMNMAGYMGMSKEDIFRSVTSSPAKAVGKEKEWGYIKEGRTADIAVVGIADEGFDLTDKAGNNIKSDKGYRAFVTISNGEVVFRR